MTDLVDRSRTEPEGVREARRRGLPHGDALQRFAALRIALTGESVVDLKRAWFTERSQVDRFLRLLGFDTDSTLDMSRLSEFLREACDYLTELHGYQIPHEVTQPKDVHDIFLMAASPYDDLQRAACMVLKVMHIMAHVAGRELGHSSNVSEAALLGRLTERVFGTVDAMRHAGFVIREFAVGKKARNSVVTKLLASRGTHAATVFDRLRFRIVLEEPSEVAKALLFLTENLIPFNYVVPGQSQNALLGEDDLLLASGLSREDLETFWPEAKGHYNLGQAAPVNEFSGKSYRAINFVADIPIRVDDLVDTCPAVAFVQAEIQLLDHQTALANESGENAHGLYKQRQRERVRFRLEGRWKPV